MKTCNSEDLKQWCNERKHFSQVLKFPLIRTLRMCTSYSSHLLYLKREVVVSLVPVACMQPSSPWAEQSYKYFIQYMIHYSTRYKGCVRVTVFRATIRVRGHDNKLGLYVRVRTKWKLWNCESSSYPIAELVLHGWFCYLLPCWP